MRHREGDSAPGGEVRPPDLGLLVADGDTLRRPLGELGREETDPRDYSRSIHAQFTPLCSSAR